MNRRIFLLSPLLAAQEPAPIRVAVSLVNVPFSVQDSGGRPELGIRHYPSP